MFKTQWNQGPAAAFNPAGRCKYYKEKYKDETKGKDINILLRYSFTSSQKSIFYIQTGDRGW